MVRRFRFRERLFVYLSGDNKGEPEQVRMSVALVKINKRDKRQTRVLLATQKALYPSVSFLALLSLPSIADPHCLPNWVASSNMILPEMTRIARVRYNLVPDSYSSFKRRIA